MASTPPPASSSASSLGDRSRARDKLRAFYKMQTAPPLPTTTTRNTNPPSTTAVAAPAAPAPTTSAQLNLDSAHFDSKKYTKQLLLTSGTQSLLQSSTTLVSSIRQIDNDMKTMVYENYSKFISATETIGRMKGDADFMDSEMGKLTRRVTSISHKTADLHRALDARRERIWRLAAEIRTLRALQMIAELPKRLSVMIGAGRFVEAAGEWSRATPLLEHYRRLGARFEGVESDGRQIMQEVEATVWRRWRSEDTGVREGAECASLLVLLRPECAPKLWRDYLVIQARKNHRCRADALDRAMNEQGRAAEFPALEGAPTGGRGQRPNAGECIARFHAEYLPVWSSLVIGFASQFLSPAGSGLIEASLSAAASKHGGRTKSLLQATTEGTVVGLLSPQQHIDGQAAAAAPRIAASRVVGWQAMDAQDLAQAQEAFAQALVEWAAEYERILESLMRFPDDTTTAANVAPHLHQLDALVSLLAQYPILSRIGGLDACVQRMVDRWQRRLVDGCLQGVVRDLIERVEYYFDPGVDQACPAAVQEEGAGGGRRSSASRHRRTMSARSNLSVGDQGLQHQRSGSAARAVSSAFEALGNALPTQPIAPASLSLSPALAPFGTNPSQLPSQQQQLPQQRVSRASTVNVASSARHASHSRSSTLRRNHQRTQSTAITDLFDAPNQASFSEDLPRPLQRRYRPWLVSSINRNAPLHVFLADIESWLIQQVLERINPLLEAVVQHYLDIEASQILDDGEEHLGLSLQSAARLRLGFISVLDQCLDTWMSEWMPALFLHVAMVNVPCGSRAYVEKCVDEAAAKFGGVGMVGDPVSSLLLARFAVDFELTLAQSIYQLCEHAILVIPEENSHGSNRGNNAQAQAQAQARLGGSMHVLEEHLQSITATTAASFSRADSMASIISGRRGAAARPGPGASGGALLRSFEAAHAAARWHSVAERLVRHFIMTVGLDISSDYLRLRPYDSTTGMFDTVQQKEEGVEEDAEEGVSEIWLSICRWMRQVENDTNALFYDPVFSATLKALQTWHERGVGDHAKQPTTIRSHPSPLSHLPQQQQQYGPSISEHAHIMSNIDRLFAQRIDIFPSVVSSLTSGKILFHLSMQIIKTAMESLRLRPARLSLRMFRKISVDAAFVRSWMLRYTGVTPDLHKLSRSPGLVSVVAVGGGSGSGNGKQLDQKQQQGQQQQGQQQGLGMKGGKSEEIINEGDARAILNLVDDWVATAKAFVGGGGSLEVLRLNEEIADQLVLNAWMDTFFC
ncbi:hypothetical protein BX661DRAFT_176492 [Kickxella alabastrina]|uniref:uncharacterized protein n=1 Tax=Kickxella alabastrina TaxID=61397 RepID=UPI00221E78DB|nr:uncharacterized protein BX661DRAFT_176492 [Kickxella alabastrina]KAI7834025.1 hypothetical protein BX661DRAFT_176492 [Kickxella alabastrina]